MFIVPGCNTPLNVYRIIGENVKSGKIDISKAKFVLVDAPIDVE